MKKNGKWALLMVTPVLVTGLVAGSSFGDEGRSIDRGFQRYGRHAHFEYGPRRRGFRSRVFWRLRRLAVMREVLGLTDDQVIKIKDIFSEGGKARIQARAEIRVARLEMRQLMRNDNVDRAAVDRKIKEISSLREKLMRNRIETRLKIRAVLTPEQRKKARAMTPFSFRGGFGHRGSEHRNF